MERTRGKVEIMPYTRRDGNNIRWVKDGKGNSICQTFKPRAEANAKHLVSCWNAFEKGGLVGRENAKVLELLQKAREMLLGPLLIFDGQDLRCVEIFIKKAEAVLEKAGKL